MDIKYTGIIVTGVVVAVGIVLILPLYNSSSTTSVLPEAKPSPNRVMLSFSILNEDNLPKWCNDLSSILKKDNVQATVFITGKTAERYSECVSIFSSNANIDIGSQTYNFVDLKSLPYNIALEEVQNGKRGVDNAGRLNSMLFKAPYGSTDQNIYSYLSRSGIIADFSYPQQYNKYENRTFIKHNLIAFDGFNKSTDMAKILAYKKVPVVINFDNFTPVNKINTIISSLKSNNDVRLVNASELTGTQLTLKKKV